MSFFFFLLNKFINPGNHLIPIAFYGKYLQIII